MHIATCTICTHVDRDEIDAALAAGQTVRAVADRFGVSKDSAHRHRHHATNGSRTPNDSITKDTATTDDSTKSPATLTTRKLYGTVKRVNGPYPDRDGKLRGPEIDPILATPPNRQEWGALVIALHRSFNPFLSSALEIADELFDQGHTRLATLFAAFPAHLMTENKTHRFAYIPREWIEGER